MVSVGVAGDTDPAFFADFDYVGIGQLWCAAPPANPNLGPALTMILDLPDGVRIGKIVVYHGDLDDTHDLGFGVAWARVGMGGDIPAAFEGGVTSSEDAPWEPDTSARVQRAELIPSEPFRVDRGTYEYFVTASFGACDTWAEGPDGAYPSLYIDGVKVEYFKN